NAGSLKLRERDAMRLRARGQAAEGLLNLRLVSLQFCRSHKPQVMDAEEVDSVAGRLFDGVDGLFQASDHERVYRDIDGDAGRLPSLPISTFQKLLEVSQGLPESAAPPALIVVLFGPIDRYIYIFDSQLDERLIGRLVQE